MPLYDYKCISCGKVVGIFKTVNEWEELIKLNDDDIMEDRNTEPCKCGGSMVLFRWFPPEWLRKKLWLREKKNKFLKKEVKNDRTNAS